MRTAEQVSRDTAVLKRGGRTVEHGRTNGDKRLAEKLKALREKHFLSLREVEAETGISNAHLSQLENARAMPSVRVASTLAVFYGASLDELCEGLLADAGRS